MPPAGRKVRVVVADHCSLVRIGVRTLLERDGGFALVGETGDGHEALALCARLTPDVLLLDLRTSGLSGLEVLREVAAQSAVRVVLLADALDGGRVVEAIRLGAQGIVFKESAPDLLLAAIRCVVAGRYWVDGDSVNELARLLRGSDGGRPTATSSGSGLTPRERDVVTAVVDGCSNREIAKRLSLSEVTVKHHLTSIFVKARISRRSELVAHALQGRLESGPVPAPSRSLPDDAAGSRDQRRHGRARGRSTRRHLGAGPGAPATD